MTRLEIYTTGLEFESGSAPLEKAWDSGPTKYIFRKIEFF
jgi:hypothetical protein